MRQLKQLLQLVGFILRHWDSPSVTVILIETPQQYHDFQMLLARGLNCWQLPPKWLIQLHDSLKEGR